MPTTLIKDVVRPNLFLVRSQKSATTSLYWGLKCRRDIFMCAPKKSGFFIDAFRRNSLCGTASTAAGHRRVYLDLFEPAGVFRHFGETTTGYSMHPALTVQAMHRFFSSSGRSFPSLCAPQH